jgi:uncharacterized protein (TIGR02646 family)
MDKLEDFIISEPYQVTDEDEAAFQEASPDEKDKDHWKKDCLDEFKERFRDDMEPKQNYICAYCRLELHPNEVTPEIEHIVPKSEKPNWMYDPFNLCISCKLCNTKKSTKEVLRDNTLKDLPHNSDAYLLIHPHLDRYSDYIEFVGDVLYKAKGDSDSKGAKTIEICELNRLEVAIARAIQCINNHGIGQHYVDFLLLMDNPINRKLIKDEDVERFRKKLKERIRVYLERQRQK